MALKSINKDLVNFLRVPRTREMSCACTLAHLGVKECHQTNAVKKVLLKLSLPRKLANA